MKRLLLLCGFLLLASVKSWAESDYQSIFEEGNRAYQAGNHAAARDAYEKVSSAGLESFALHYNLGCAYYRLGKLGRSRLCFERARLLKTDDDVEYNLGMIRNQIQDARESALSLWLRRFGGFFLWGFLLVNGAFFAFLTAGLFRQSEGLWWGRWITGFLFFTALVAWAATAPQRGQTNGIVLDSRAEVRAGPADEYRATFIAPEGLRVVLMEAAGDWTQIGVPSKGLKGWVKSSAVEAVR